MASEGLVRVRVQEAVWQTSACVAVGVLMD